MRKRGLCKFLTAVCTIAVAAGIFAVGSNDLSLQVNAAQNVSAGDPNVSAGDAEVEINSTNFPDSIFRGYVSAAIDIDRNGKLSESEIAGVVKLNDLGAANLSDTTDHGVADFTGIQYFTQLQEFNCSRNMLLTNLDLSKNTELIKLDCSYTNLATVDLSKNTKLQEFRGTGSMISSLDVSKNKELWYFNADRMRATSIDLSNNKKVSYIESNASTIVGFDQLSDLSILVLTSGSSIDIDLNNYPKMKVLHLVNMKSITGLETCSNLTELGIRYYYAKGFNIDFSNHPNLLNITMDTNMSFSNIESCSKLMILRLYGDVPHIRSIDFSHFPDLYSLYIGNSVDATNLEACTKLQSLTCSGSAISGCGLDPFPKLTYARINLYEPTLRIADLNMDVSKFKDWENVKDENGNVVSASTQSKVLHPIMTYDYSYGDFGAYIYCTYKTDKVSIPVSFFLLWNVGDQPAAPAPASPAPEDTLDHVTTAAGQTITSTVATKVSAAVSAAVASHRSLVNFAAGLTAEETANGDFVEVTIKSSVCGEAAMEAIQNAANALSAQIAMILDIQVNKIAKNGAPISSVSLLQQAISISLSSPEGVDPNLYDFAVIRLHEGKTDILPDMDSDPNTITFTTDRFSPYTIVYGAKGSFDAYKTAAVSATQSAGRSPKTGEAYPYALPITLLFTICSGCGIIVISKKARRS